MTGLPVVIDATSVTALVVGGGRVGTRRAEALLDAGAAVHVVAPVISDGLRRRGVATERLRLTQRPYSSDDIEDATLVIAATDDRAVNAQVADDAHAAHRLVSVADAPGEGTFFVAAAHRAGTLVIGVVAGGVPRAAMRIRDAIAARFDVRYEKALEALARARRAEIDAGAAPRWQASLDSLIGADFCESVEEGGFFDRLATWG